MARTIRRTTGRNKHGVVMPTHNSWIHPYDPPDEDSYRRRTRGLTPEQAKTWEIARFQRHHDSGHLGVHRWFRNRLNRYDRHYQRREIYRCLKQEDFDDFLVIDPPDGAKWYWW